ncbi:Protein EMSY-LIKE 3 [Hordeum vulgare]|nr:Protein EMSY-LIKE 3 [Hordeum vulgare]
MKLKNSFREADPITVQSGYGFRPNQPAVVHQTRCRWIIGDVTEVFDHNTWKLGKIAKIVKNDYFVIRLADCIQLKEFHISSMRVPLALDTPTAPPHGKQFPAADNKVIRRGKQLPADVLRRSGKKRRSSEVLDFSPRPSQRRLFQVAREEAAAAECSVASCSAANDDAGVGVSVSSGRHGGCCSVGRGDAQSRVVAGSPRAAWSSSDSEGALSDGGPAGVDVHELELEAYRSTVRALHASGPLTWEQESLLTNLRLSLNISNEEHLRQLRRLLSS